MPSINSPTPDATTVSKGKVQLGGVLAGTAASPALATNAITLSSIGSSTSQTGITSSPVILTGLSATVTNPVGGRNLRVEVQVPNMSSTNICTWTLYIYNSATVTGSPIQTMKILQSIAGVSVSGYTFWEGSLASGSQSFCAAISTDTGTGVTALLTTQKSFITIKVE